MQSARPVAVHVMGATEGAAWRVQLDSMVKVLSAYAVDAFEAGDTDVLTLYQHLTDAQAIAAQIEQRDQAPASYKGVDLIKH